MSDNTVIPAGVGGDNVRTVDKGRTDLAKTQVMALDIGSATEKIWRGDKTTNDLLLKILDELVAIRTELRGF
jgi:hypothetical protein